MTKRKEFAFYLCGSAGSGKTTKAKKIIEAYYSEFDIVIVLKTTPDYEEYSEFSECGNFIISMFENHKFNDLIEEKMKKKKLRRLRYLLVLDDCVGFIRKTTLERVFNRRRHLRISLIFVSQSYKRLDNEFRNNLNVIYFFKQSDENFFKFFKANITPDPKIINYLKNTEHPTLLYHLKNGGLYYV